MRLIIAGNDRSQDLGRQIQEAAEARARKRTLHLMFPEHSALSLRDARTESEYQTRFITLLGARHGVNTSFPMPRRPGLPGILLARIRDFAWRLVHNRIIRIVHDQNVFNELLTIAAELENLALRKEIQALNRRLDELEKRQAPASAPAGEAP